MVAPVASGLTLITNGSTPTGGVTGVTNAATFINNAPGSQYRNSSVITAPSKVGGYFGISAVDLSAPGTFVLVDIGVNTSNNQVATYTTGGLSVALLTNTSNYLEYRVWDRSLTAGVIAASNSETIALLQVSSTSHNSYVLQQGTFNSASVTGVGTWWQQTSTSLTILYTKWWYYGTAITLTEGDNVNGSAWFSHVNSYIASIYTTAVSSGSSAISNSPAGYSSQFFCGLPVRFGNGSGNLYSVISSPQIVTFQFTAKDSVYSSSYKFTAIQASDNFLGVEFYLAASNTLDWSFVAISSPNKWKFIVNSSTSTSATLKFSFCTFANIGTSQFRSPFNAISCTFSQCDAIDPSNATFTRSVFSSSTGSYAVLANTTSTLSNCTISNNTVGLQIASTGTYSNISGTISNNTTGVSITSAVTSGTINLSNLAFTGNTTDIYWAGTSGSVTIIVSQTGLTTSSAGGTINLQVPSVNLTAPNFANGSRYQVSRLQIFSVASSAINTTTDELTLGTDSNGNAPSLQTSTPYSLVRISLASGATIPVSSPQIFDGGLYRIKTNSSGVVTLSTTEGGTTIDFQSAGTNNGSGQLLTLTTITNLARGTVSGGSGLSIPLSLPTGALLDVKAIDYSEASGSTITSQISQNTLAWNSVSGATIVDTVNRTDPTSAWTLVNRIAQISTIELSATVVDNNGVVYTSFNPSNTGSTVTGLSWALEGVGRIQINANESDGLIWAQDLVLWAAYIFSTADGLWLASADTITLNDLYTVIIKNIEFDETSGNILQIAGMYIGSASGQSIVSSSTTGPVVPNVATQGNGAIVETGTSGLTPAESTTLSTLGSQLNLLYKRQGLQAGISASEKDATTGSPGFVTTSDGSVNQTIVKNGDGSITISSS